MIRLETFVRDDYRCVYCGIVYEAAGLSIDHVQPLTRGGDSSSGNVVTACRSCNARKGDHSLASFLADNASARRNFLMLARYVWPRHMKAVAEELVRRGMVETSSELVEGVRGLRSSEAIASLLIARIPRDSCGE